MRENLQNLNFIQVTSMFWSSRSKSAPCNGITAAAAAAACNSVAAGGRGNGRRFEASASRS